MSLLTMLLRLVRMDPRGYPLGDETFLNNDGRDEVVLTEGKRSVRIYSERGVDPDRTVHTDSIASWEPPHEHEPFTDVDRDRILQKLIAHMDNVKTTYKII